MKLMLCSCDKSQSLDREAIASATGLTCSRVHSALCTSELAEAAAALGEGDTIIACGQETAIFEALADELALDPPQMVDIRDRAGWSDEGKAATPKIAALLADAGLALRPAPTIDIPSEGMCLILGTAEIVLPVAEQLAESLAVTVVTTDAPDFVPGATRKFDLMTGKLRNATGSLGRFEVGFDGLSVLKPGGRGTPEFSDPRDGGRSECDIILDLRGETPLFAAHDKRDGYLRADPGDPLAVARAVFEASHLTGTFEKPLYVRLEESLCAHSRAGQPACTRCLDVCPTGAITSAGDTVAIDPNICAGCGSCSAVCPSGAVAYDDPAPSHLFTRMRTLAAAYLDAGGTNPRLLVHDAEHGGEMISLAARFGRGLPSAVIPMEVSNLAGFGHAEFLVALASGFTGVDILVGPRTEREALDPQFELTRAMLEGLGVEADRIRLIEPEEPDALCDLLYGHIPNALKGEAVLTLGGRREATRLAARALADEKDAVIALPEGAPYGAVLVDTEACTLCLACASLCPPGALGDNPDRPELRFKEDACLQCGLCAQVCPEDAIMLKPQLNLADAALQEQVLNEEEPYPCIECGKLFGVRSTIERIVAKLENQHSMFTNSDNARLIRMCDDCRVNAQYHSEAAPFQMGARPKVRTTADYLAERDTDKPV